MPFPSAALKGDILDNFRFDITGEGDISLAMKIAFSQTHSATGYCIRPAEGEKCHRLILFKTKPDDVDEREGPVEVYRAFDFGFDIRAEGAAEIARRFLLKADYPQIAPVSGSSVRGWRLYNEAWGHVDHDWRAFAAIAPTWIAS
jgi:hypothetical protein